MAAKRLKIEKASDVLKYKEDDIKRGSKEEWLYNMEKGRAWFSVSCVGGSGIIRGIRLL